MSFDLFFRPRDGAVAPTMISVQRYFEARAHYRVSEKQAFYENEATGVYFSFDINPEENPDAENPAHRLSFNINYFRPHAFGLEADNELAPFVRHFDLLVSDPQSEGMGEGEYTSQGFLRGWNAGNLFAVGAINRYPGQIDVLTLPHRQIEEFWRWNFGRAALQSRLGPEVFVPQILYVRHAGHLRSAAVWPNAINEAIPPVDLLLLFRRDLPGVVETSDKPEMFVVPRAEVLKLPIDWTPLSDHDDSFVVEEDFPPDELVEFFLTQQSNTDKLEGVAFDKILDREVVEKAQALAPKGEDNPSTAGG